VPTYRLLKMGVEAVAGIARERIPDPRAGAEESASGAQLSHAGSPASIQAEVSRLCQGANSESLDLREVLEGVVALLAPVSQRTGQHISLEAADPWPKMTARKVVLRQGLLVLLKYALEEAAGGDLVIRTALADRALHLTIVEAAQPGRPQPPAMPADPHACNELETARALLAAQGGRLEVGHDEGRWRARVHLPVTGRTTILVIDDNPEIIALVRRYLAGYDLEVIGAGSGADGLGMAAAWRPRLIILDVMLPDLDGWEVLQRLKSMPATRDIPVIIYTVLHVSQLAEAMGADAYVAKPISQGDLLAAVTRLLGLLLPAG
jgi:CheY-like chemotaxis protein